MKDRHTTPEVARMLGLKTYQITQAIYNNIATPPKKNKSGRYVWTLDDIRRLRGEMGRVVGDEVIV